LIFIFIFVYKATTANSQPSTSTSNTYTIQMATDTTTSMTFAEKMRQNSLAASRKEENTTAPEAETIKKVDDSWKEKKRFDAITQLFETKVVHNAMHTIEARSNKGFFSTNLFTYHFGDYFYINDKDGCIISIDDFTPNGKFLYRTHKMVMDPHFQELISNFSKGLGIKFCCRRAGKTLNVVEVFWGNTQYHKWNNDDSVSEETPLPAIPEDKQPAPDTSDKSEFPTLTEPKTPKTKSGSKPPTTPKAPIKPKSGLMRTISAVEGNLFSALPEDEKPDAPIGEWGTAE